MPRAEFELERRGRTGIVAARESGDPQEVPHATLTAILQRSLQDLLGEACGALVIAGPQRELALGAFDGNLVPRRRADLQLQCPCLVERARGLVDVPDTQPEVGEEGEQADARRRRSAELRDESRYFLDPVMDTTGGDRGTGRSTTPAAGRPRYHYSQRARSGRVGCRLPRSFAPSTLGRGHTSGRAGPDTTWPGGRAAIAMSPPGSWRLANVRTVSGKR